MADELFESDVFTLTDEEGNEEDYELIGTVEVDEKVYYALVPVSEEEKDARTEEHNEPICIELYPSEPELREEEHAEDHENDRCNADDEIEHFS